jgi:hypothetical protein
MMAGRGLAQGDGHADMARSRFCEESGVTTQEGGRSTAWRRSSACEHTACVEVQVDWSTVRVRNSRHPDLMVEFTFDEWEAFLRGARAGEFEHRRPFLLT